MTRMQHTRQKVCNSGACKRWSALNGIRFTHEIPNMVSVISVPWQCHVIFIYGKTNTWTKRQLMWWQHTIRQRKKISVSSREICTEKKHVNKKCSLNIQLRPFWSYCVCCCVVWKFLPLLLQFKYCYHKWKKCFVAMPSITAYITFFL